MGLAVGTVLQPGVLQLPLSVDPEYVPKDIPSVVDGTADNNFLLWGICASAAQGKGGDAACSVDFKYGMKRDFNLYLNSLGPTRAFKTLTDLRTYNSANVPRGAIKYGQVLLDISDQMDLVADLARYQADRAKDLRLSDTHGIGEAMQRNNLEMGNIAPQDISNQIPAWSIVTSAYLFRDANHLNKFFASDAGAEMKKMAYYVDRWLRLFPYNQEGNCFPRSLALYRLARRRGFPVRFHCGVKKGVSGLEGHAWLTLESKTVYEPGMFWRDFTVTFSYPPDSVTHSEVLGLGVQACNRWDHKQEC